MGLKTDLSDKIIDCYQEILNNEKITDYEELCRITLKAYRRLLDAGYTPSENSTNAFLKVLEHCSEDNSMGLTELDAKVILKAGSLSNRYDLITTIFTNLLHVSISNNFSICPILVNYIDSSITEQCPYLIVAKAYYQIIQYYSGKKEFEKCSPYFDKLESIVTVVDDPKIIYYYYLSYGCFHYTQGELFKAIHFLNRVVSYKDNPPDSSQYYRAHFLLALSYASNSIMDKAIEHIDVLLNENSGFNKLKLSTYKARMFSQRKDFVSAERILSDLLAKNKDNEQVSKLVNADLFMISLMQDNSEKIQKYYELIDDKSLSNIPKLFRDYYYLHTGELDQIKLESIYRDYEKASRDKNPYSKQYLNFLVEYYIRKQDYQNAYDQFQELLKKNREIETQYKILELESYLNLLEKYEEFKSDEMSKRDLVSSIEKSKLEKSIVGKSLELRKVLGDSKIVANAHFSNVLLTGETGTGKELIAKLIHYNSNRRNKNFCEINLSALSPTLIESELFGYKKGAFTGALQDKKGLLEIVHNGTLFLDEISEIPTEIQTKLLKVIEEKSFYPIGATKPMQSNFRLICATNKDLKSLAEQDKFRIDLYYRLSSYEIVIPALRKRKSDIPLLVKYFIKIFSDELKRPEFSLTDNQMDLLLQYDFPGNVRELKNLAQRIVICYHNGQAVDNVINSFITSREMNTELSTFNLEKIEKDTIIRALKRCKGVQSQAAKLLGISNNAIARKISKHGLRDICK